MSDSVTAGPGEVPAHPTRNDIYVSEVNTGQGDIGLYFEWQNIAGGYILAKDTDSFVSLDNYA